MYLSLFVCNPHLHPCDRCTRICMDTTGYLLFWSHISCDNTLFHMYLWWMLNVNGDSPCCRLVSIVGKAFIVTSRVSCDMWEGERCKTIILCHLSWHVLRMIRMGLSPRQLGSWCTFEMHFCYIYLKNLLYYESLNIFKIELLWIMELLDTYLLTYLSQSTT